MSIPAMAAPVAPVDTLITFDGITAVSGSIPAVSGNFVFDGYVFNDVTIANVSNAFYLRHYGTANSGSNVLLASGSVFEPQPMTKQDGGLFKLNSFYAKFNQGWSGSLNQTATGYLNGVSVFSLNYTLSSFVSFAPYQKITTNFGATDKVTFSTRGIDVWVDSVSVSAVPEPSNWALLTIGFGVMGAGLRRQRRMAKMA